MIAISVVDNKRDCFAILRRHSEFLKECFWYEDNSANSIGEYNNLMTSISFWDKFNDHKVLVCQHDSGLLRTGIEEFLEYDFIGAPLYHIDFPCMNGGLSLRSPKAMIACIKDMPFDQNKHGNEDIYFCKQLQKLGFNLPTKEVAQKFSVETIYGLGSLGYHAIHKHLTPQQCETILNQYK